MPHPELDRLEGDVREARRRLKSDLEVLRAPETFSSFKEDVMAGLASRGTTSLPM